MSGISRRDLIKNAAGSSLAIAGAGTFLAACGSSSSETSGAGVSSAEGTPQRGGILRLGLTGSASSDSFDPHVALSDPDFARAELLFEGLIGADATGRSSRMLLAEELTPNATATEWTIRVRKGIQFHNGKELTADDVIYTFNRILDPKEPLLSAGSLEPLDMKNAKKLDQYTVRIPTTRPFAILDQQLAAGQFGGAAYTVIVPEGFDPKKPVGTGPFKYVSFTPNVSTEVARNENYWRKGLPYLDGVKMTSYADEVSQVNALISGQEDAINSLSIGSVAPVEGGGKDVQISDTGKWIPFVMRSDVDPFSDLKVRQAMRLIVDRPQILEQVYGGHGTLGNDVFGIFGEEYDHSLPQRSQDIEQAKSLLKAAGQSDLQIELLTAPVAQGATPAAEVFAQQAQAAGVTINLKKGTPTELYGANYLNWKFTQDFWLGTPYLNEVGLATLSRAPLNETHFNSPRFDSLYGEALAETDLAKRKELTHEMQRIEYDEGGYIIPFFAPVIDGLAPNVNGITGTRSGLSLHDYNFTSTWLS